MTKTPRSCRRWGHKKKLIWRNQHAEENRCKRCRRRFVTWHNPLGKADSLLKKYYEGAIRKQLNQESSMMKLFRTHRNVGYQWQGRQVVFPIHTGGWKWKLKNLWSILTRKLF